MLSAKQLMKGARWKVYSLLTWLASKIKPKPDHKWNDQYLSEYTEASGNWFKDFMPK